MSFSSIDNPFSEEFNFVKTNEINYVRAEEFYDFINSLYKKKKRQENKNGCSYLKYLKQYNKSKEETDNKINKKNLKLKKMNLFI